MILCYITCRDKREAIKVARHLLKKRLIACANYFQTNSLYWWNRKIASEKETVLIAKTLKKYAGKVEEEIKRVHSYTIPCMLLFDVNANKEFEKWAYKEIK